MVFSYKEVISDVEADGVIELHLLFPRARWIERLPHSVSLSSLCEIHFVAFNRLIPRACIGLVTAPNLLIMLPYSVINETASER